jgi:hypothetical protein
MEIPDPIVDIPKPVLLDPQFNMPLVTDFLDEDAVLKLDYFRVLRTVRLHWSFRAVRNSATGIAEANSVHGRFGRSGLPRVKGPRCLLGL